MWIQSNTPFFTDNWIGILKVIGIVVVPITGFLTWAMLKIVRGPNQEADRLMREDLSKLEERLDADVNGLGERFNSVEHSCTSSQTSMEEMRRRLDGSELRIDAIREGMGEMRKSVQHLENMTITTKTEIIDVFQRSTKEQVEAVHELEILVARMDERIKKDGSGSRNTES